jgi:glutamine synthetase
MMLSKYIVRNVAYQYGKNGDLHAQASCLATTAAECIRTNPCGGTASPLFAGDGYAGLSQMALNYIGGLLKHARALSAIIAPTTNSYKRLVPGYEAPVTLPTRGANRCGRHPHPMYSASPKAKRVEFRPPDPSCNPYLAFAAMMMAGLDGILNKIDPGVIAGQGHLRSLRRKRLRRCLRCRLLSTKRWIAWTKITRSSLKGDVFTEDLIETFIAYKRRHEAEAVRCAASLRVRPLLRHLRDNGEPVSAAVRPIVGVRGSHPSRLCRSPVWGRIWSGALFRVAGRDELRSTHLF